MKQAFAVYEKETGRNLAVLPLTIPIGATVERFERAGFKVGWAWATINEEEDNG